MKNLLLGALLLLAGIAITSCSDNELPNETANVRDYQTDARILNRFVDVNKTVGEYYINEGKKGSPLSYITNEDWEELQKVNPVNRVKFENDLNTLNSQLALAAQRSDVSQIVYTTYGETWVRTLDDDAPFAIEESNAAETRAARTNYAHIQLMYNLKQYANFTAGRQVWSEINVNLFGYRSYFIEVNCQIEASKEYTGAGGDNPKAVILSGSTSVEYFSFTWNAKSSETSISWKFVGAQYSPQDMNNLITVDFIN